MTDFSHERPLSTDSPGFTTIGERALLLSDAIIEYADPIQVQRSEDGSRTTFRWDDFQKGATYELELIKSSEETYLFVEERREPIASTLGEVSRWFYVDMESPEHVQLLDSQGDILTPEDGARKIAAHDLISILRDATGLEGREKLRELDEAETRRVNQYFNILVGALALSDPNMEKGLDSALRTKSDRRRNKKLKEIIQEMMARYPLDADSAQRAISRFVMSTARVDNISRPNRQE